MVGKDIITTDVDETPGFRIWRGAKLGIRLQENSEESTGM
jgi:hypothetical protein